MKIEFETVTHVFPLDKLSKKIVTDVNKECPGRELTTDEFLKLCDCLDEAGVSYIFSQASGEVFKNIFNKFYNSGESIAQHASVSREMQIEKAQFAQIVINLNKDVIQQKASTLGFDIISDMASNPKNYSKYNSSKTEKFTLSPDDALSIVEQYSAQHDIEQSYIHDTMSDITNSPGYQPYHMSDTLQELQEERNSPIWQAYLNMVMTYIYRIIGKIVLPIMTVVLIVIGCMKEFSAYRVTALLLNMVSTAMYYNISKQYTVLSQKTFQKAGILALGIAMIVVTVINIQRMLA